MRGLKSLECFTWQPAHQAGSVRKGLQRHIVLRAQLLHKTCPWPQAQQPFPPLCRP